MTLAPHTTVTTSKAEAGLPLHDAKTLTSGGACAAIRLGDQIYTLRITKTGKLILTK